MYTFSELQIEVGRLAQRSGDSDYLTKIKDWLNLGQKYLADSYDFWSALQASPYSFTSVNGTEKYYLPSDFDKPYRIFDTTNYRKLSWITREEYFDGNISSIASSSTGIPQYASLYGISAVSYVNTSSFTVKVKSSSSSDNTGIVCRVEGWLDSAKTILGYESITIDTGSPTTYTSGSVTFYGITKFSKSADTTGYVTLADNSSNILATIAPVDRESRYPILYLGLIPGGSYTYQILYKKSIKRMVNDNDYPFMDCSDFLVLYALGYAFHQEKESESRAQDMWKKANDLMALLMRNEQDKMGPGFQHRMTNLTGQTHRF